MKIIYRIFKKIEKLKLFSKKIRLMQEIKLILTIKLIAVMINIIIRGTILRYIERNI